jgi:hypothetical protein
LSKYLRTLLRRFTNSSNGVLFSIMILHVNNHDPEK